jgi:putative ABC transport system permease protein
MKINDQTFEVIGIIKNESSMMETIIAMPLDDARAMSTLATDKVSSYYVELENAKDDDKIKKIIEFKYGNQVDAQTSSDYSDQFNSVLGNFRMVVFLVGLLAAIVSAIGVINTMLMNVMERKREIGTLKASGWSSRHIIKMILIEAILIGIIGALLGLILGLSLTYILNSLFGLDSVITQELLIESALFAIGLSLFAGLYPAYRAAKLDPVEAMTY